MNSEASLLMSSVDVILSGVTASLSEAVTQSKDPYPRHGLIGSAGVSARAPMLPEDVPHIGVLRLHLSIRERMESFRSG